MKLFLKALTALMLLTASASECSAAGKCCKLPAGFAWGADLGGAIDLTGNDMSALAIEARFGYRRGIVDFVGIGAGIDMVVNNSNRIFPVYAALQTNFSTRPSLCFLDARIGCAFANLADNQNQTALFASPGLGVNLAKGKTFSSYLILSYQYIGLKDYHDSETIHNLNGIHMAAVRLGISF
jgi:hypothetical protein